MVNFGKGLQPTENYPLNLFFFSIKLLFLADENRKTEILKSFRHYMKELTLQQFAITPKF